MKKISRIKLLFVLLPIIAITLLLIIRWNEYGKSYKSLANWGLGRAVTSERIYFCSRLQSIITKWQKAGNNTDDINDSNSTFLYIDLDKNAIWLEIDGQIDIANYSNLPENVTWQMNDSEKKLPGRIILRTKKNNEQIKGAIYLMDNNNPNNMFFGFDTDIYTSSDINRGRSNPFDLYSPNISLLIVHKSEYQQNKEFIPEGSLGQIKTNEDSEKTALQENKTRWFEAEKLLYMEIDGQIQNSGYQLDSLEMEPSPDYKSAYAIIQGHGKSIIHRLLGLGGGSKTIQAYLKIDYLGYDIWYAKTAPHPTHKLESDRKLNLEFLVYADEQIPRSQYKKYIKQGRKLQQSKK